MPKATDSIKLLKSQLKFDLPNFDITKFDIPEMPAFNNDYLKELMSDTAQ